MLAELLKHIGEVSSYKKGLHLGLGGNKKDKRVAAASVEADSWLSLQENANNKSQVAAIGTAMHSAASSEK